MRNLSVGICLFVALGSLEGCVAATRATEPGDSAVPEEAGSADAGPGADAGADHPDETGFPEASSEGGHRDASGDARLEAGADAHAEAGKGDGAVVDASMGSDAADTAPPLDSGPVCVSPETLCGASCVDVQTDPDHCGDCTTVCAAVSEGAPSCGGGTCGFVCDSGYHACGAGCDDNTSIETCGDSCTPCSPPADATATCDGTSCGFVCDSGYHACGGACDVNTSIDSCGSSCTACAPPVNATATCDGVSCGFTCNAGTVSCAGGTACCMQNALAGGDEHACEVLTTGVVRCLGHGTSGQLGNGSKASQFLPVDVTGISGTPIAVVAGYDHTCALTSASGMFCWGDNDDGDLGIGSTTASDVAVAVSGLSSGVVGMAAGYQHVCALLSTGSVDCWGSNSDGQIGNGSTSASETTPQPVSGLTGVIGIAAGGSHTCAVKVDGSVWCWGSNEFAQLGVTSPSSSDVPVEVTTVTGAVAITAGTQHTCALTNSGSVWCWGFDEDGEVGNGFNWPVAAPAAIPASKFGGLPVMGISAPANGYHTCAFTSANVVYCWGFNQYGQLGNGTVVSNASPVLVPDLLGTGTTEAIMTEDHASCVSEHMGVWCWGEDNVGQLGNAISVSEYTTPIGGLYL